MRTLILATCVSAFAAPALADDQPKGPSDFAGNWQIAFQADESVIVNEPVVSCSAPAVIKLTDDNSIHVKTPGGDMGFWQVRGFSGKNPWWPEDAEGNSTNGENLVAKWTGENSFVLASRIPGTGSFDYAGAKEWTRCPE